MSLTRFETRLRELTPENWSSVVEAASSKMHKVDQTAVKIWFAFYPLVLSQHLDKAEDLEKELHGLAMQGGYTLDDKIDTSHNFLYGHRFWADVKHAVATRAKSFDGATIDLLEEAELLAKSVAVAAKVDISLVVGITMVALMTLTRTGLDAFSATAGDIAKPKGLLAKSPAKIVEKRASEKKQGIFSFLKTIDKEFEITWDENDPKAKFSVIYDEEIASAAAKDQSRDWVANDPRCGEGVIPVECRSAACGTCWVGVVSGAERLSDVDRLERKQMKVFGYGQGDEAKPFLRLACQARAEGSASIILPTWNGVFGKKLFGLEKITLEPATTSAVKLRETIAELLETEQ